MLQKSLKAVLYLAYCLLLVGGALELVTRYFFEAPQIVKISGHESASTLRLDRTPNAQTLYYQTFAGKRLRANTTATIVNHMLSGKDIVVRTNSLGYRGKEIAADSSKRVLFLGDSITLADYVPEEQSFVAIVEQLLQKDWPSLQTLNAGVGATGVDNYLSILRETGLSTKPDVVVVGLYLNDFQPTTSNMLFHPPRMLQWSWLINRIYQSLSVIRAKRSGRPELAVPAQELAAWKSEIAQSFVEREPNAGEDRTFLEQVLFAHIDWGGAWSEGAWLRMRKPLEQIADLLRQQGIPLLVVSLPVREQVEAQELYDYPQRRAAEIADQLGAAYLDLLPVLRKAAANKLYYDHCHFAPEGNRLVAEEISNILNQLLARK